MNPVEPHISPERVRELFDYNSTTGEFWRRSSGIIYSSLSVWIDGRTYEIGRVIWCWYYKEWPPLDKYVDHEDKLRHHNWITNLRLATPTQNASNQGRKGTYHKGVTYRSDVSSKPWVARISISGTRIHLGFYDTHDEAAEAYREACVEFHGEFACYD